MFTDQPSSPLACPGASEVTPLRQRAARTLCLIAPLLLFGASAAHAVGDAAAGQKVFTKCAACHSTAAGQNKIGPSLADVVGRKILKAPDLASEETAAKRAVGNEADAQFAADFENPIFRIA